MLETYFRPVYQNIFVNKVAQKLKFMPADYITLLGLLLGVAVLPALYFQQILLACILLLLSGYFDTLDGTVARMQENISPRGCILDIIADRIVEFSVILGLFLIDPSRALACIFMLGSILLCVTSFLVVGLFTPNTSEKSFYYSVGLIERAEAFIFFIAMMIFSHYFYILAWIFSGLVLFTTIIRVYQCCSQLQHPLHYPP